MMVILLYFSLNKNNKLEERSLKICNYTRIRGQEIQLIPFRQGGIGEKMSWNIFVKNLPKDAKSKDLYDLLIKFGRIFSCRVKYGNNGLCKGYGFVQFEDQKSAEEALQQENPFELKGNRIELIRCRPRQIKNNADQCNNVYIKGIPKQFSNGDLHNLFSSYGNILSALVIKDSTDASENKGVGFVCFEKAEDMQKAIQELNGKGLSTGEKLFVSQALTGEDQKKQLHDERLKMYKDRNLYVKHLPNEMTDESLKSLFEQFGTVISAKVMLEKVFDSKKDNYEARSSGYGFVCFSSTEDARKAIVAASSSPINGHQLYVSMAQNKKDRSAKFENQQPYYPPQMQSMYQMPLYGMFPPRYRRPKYVVIKISLFYRKEKDDKEIIQEIWQEILEI